MMSEDVIKDASGRTLGFVRTSPSGGQQAYDVNRRLVGSYDAQNNITKDVNGRAIAKGNIASALIHNRK
jgi:hypothetical protein